MKGRIRGGGYNRETSGAWKGDKEMRGRDMERVLGEGKENEGERERGGNRERKRRRYKD